MENKIKLCVEAYKKDRNLKRVSTQTGVKWQTVYWYLKKAGVEVNGDKELYGSVKDKFAYKGEKYIQDLIPNSINQNTEIYQPEIDFIINSYGVEVKSGKISTKKPFRWAFSLKKQIRKADFFILLGYDRKEENVIARFVIPTEMLRGTIKSIYIPEKHEVSKWNDFFVTEEDLKTFFEEV